MKRGEVWWAELHPRSGSELKGGRPVIVISNDGFNSVAEWRSVIVIPFSTSKRQLMRGPSAVFVEKGEGGLAEDSVALCHQVTTVDRSKLTARLGILHSLVLEAVETGIRAALDLL